MNTPSDRGPGKLGEPVAWALDTPYGRGYSFAQELLDHLDGWLPFETAPEDGTRVLVTDGEEVVISAYTSLFSWVHDGPVPLVTGRLTHWQPLPSPPLPTQEMDHED